MRAPVDTLSAPTIPAGLQWVNVATLRMDQRVGRLELQVGDGEVCHAVQFTPGVLSSG